LTTSSFPGDPGTDTTKAIYITESKAAVAVRDFSFIDIAQYGAEYFDRRKPKRKVLTLPSKKFFGQTMASSRESMPTQYRCR